MEKNKFLSDGIKHSSLVSGVFYKENFGGSNPFNTFQGHTLQKSSKGVVGQKE